MFAKKKKYPAESEKKAVPSPDFVVRNMPKAQALSGVSYQPADFGSGFQKMSGANHPAPPAAPDQNFKKIGLVIIIGGVVIVIALVYLSYIFLIKPSVKPSPNSDTPPLADSALSASQPSLNLTAPPLSPIIVTTSTDLVATSSSPSFDTSTSSATTTAPDIVVAPAPILDSDNDSLKDEEELILGTNPNSTDSDGDSYYDLAELNSSYNPAGSGPLSNNANLGEYQHPASSYRVLFPKNWEQEAVDDNNTVIFKAPDDSLIQISLQANADQQSIVGWYGNAFPTSLITYDKLKNASTWEGIFGDDGLNFYLTDAARQYIYVISYIPVDERRLAYPNIFQTFINSLKID